MVRRGAKSGHLGHFWPARGPILYLFLIWRGPGTPPAGGWPDGHLASTQWPQMAIWGPAGRLGRGPDGHLGPRMAGSGPWRARSGGSGQCNWLIGHLARWPLATWPRAASTQWPQMAIWGPGGLAGEVPDGHPGPGRAGWEAPDGHLGPGWLAEEAPDGHLGPGPAGWEGPRWPIWAPAGWLGGQIWPWEGQIRGPAGQARWPLATWPEHPVHSGPRWPSGAPGGLARWPQMAIWGPDPGLGGPRWPSGPPGGGWEAPDGHLGPRGGLGRAQMAIWAPQRGQSWPRRARPGVLGSATG